MKWLLKLEELAMFIVSLVLLNSDADWYWYVLLLIGPDVSILGYLINNRVGAICYNLFHHKGLAIVLFFIGMYAEIDWVLNTGAVLFGHASLDRMLGFGLKHYQGFGFTHLGQIGKDKNTQPDILSD